MASATAMGGRSSEDERVASGKCDADSPAPPPATLSHDVNAAEERFTPDACMRVCRELFGLLIPAFRNDLQTTVVRYRQRKQDVLEFHKDRNLQDGDLWYLLLTQIVGTAKQLIEDLSATFCSCVGRGLTDLDAVEHCVQLCSKRALRFTSRPVGARSTEARSADGRLDSDTASTTEVGAST